MPSQKILEEKKQVVKELSERMKSAVTGVLVEYKGITVVADTKLRVEMRKAGVKYEVCKNTLTLLAAREAGLGGLESVLTGTTAIATSDSDMVAPAKILMEFAKKNDFFKIKAGFLEGKIVTAAQIEALAALPPKPVLVAQVLGGLNAPITSFAGVLSATMRGLCVALNAIAEKQGESA